MASDRPTADSLPREPTILFQNPVGSKESGVSRRPRTLSPQQANDRFAVKFGLGEINATIIVDGVDEIEIVPVEISAVFRFVAE